MKVETLILLHKVRPSYLRFFISRICFVKQFILVFVCCISISIPFAFAGGPWVPDKKNGFAQAQITFPLLLTKKLFMADGTTFYVPRLVGDYTFQQYTELGVGKNTGIIFSLPAKYVFTKGDVRTPNAELYKNIPSGGLTGLGNIEFSVKHNFYNRSFLASGSLALELPTGKTNKNNGLYTAYPALSVIPTLHIGKSFLNNIYAFTNIGYAIKTSNYSHDIRWLAEGGKKWNKNIWMAVLFDVRLSMYNGTEYSYSNELTGLYSNNQEWFSYGVKIAYEYEEKIGFTISGFGAAYGNLTAKSPFLNTGIFVKW